MTQQHFAHGADVRNIISQYDRTGLIANVARGVAQYGDYSEINEYRESLDLINNANDMFQQLPAEIREIFKNDAGDFFEFATNPANESKMIELGLREPNPAEVVPPVSSAEPKKAVESPDSPSEVGE
jgi:SHS2 domain-containing protein